MKTTNYLWLAIIFGLICVPPSDANEKVLIFSSNYEPYYGEQMADFGPVAKLTLLAFAETGYDAEVVFRPWARALKEGEAGKCDVLLGGWFDTEWENWMALTDAMLDNEVGFYKRKDDDVAFKDYADLKAKKVVIGTVQGYINPDGFLAADLMTEQVTEDLQVMRMLVANRIRLALVDKYLGRYLLKKEGRENEIEWLTTLQIIPFVTAS